MLETVPFGFKLGLKAGLFFQTMVNMRFSGAFECGIINTNSATVDSRAKQPYSPLLYFRPLERGFMLAVVALVVEINFTLQPVSLSYDIMKLFLTLAPRVNTKLQLLVLRNK